MLLGDGDGRTAGDGMYVGNLDTALLHVTGAAPRRSSRSNGGATADAAARLRPFSARPESAAGFGTPART